MTFQSTQRPARATMQTLRLTADQSEQLQQMADRIEVSKSEVLRIALDHWLATAAPRPTATSRRRRRQA